MREALTSEVAMALVKDDWIGVGLVLGAGEKQSLHISIEEMAAELEVLGERVKDSLDGLIAVGVFASTEEQDAFILTELGASTYEQLVSDAETSEEPST